MSIVLSIKQRCCFSNKRHGIGLLVKIHLLCKCLENLIRWLYASLVRLVKSLV